MTETDQRSHTAGTTEFYDSLAPLYDDMTGFEKRFVKEQPSFNVLVQRFGITSALDAGCGTGFHSLLLARLGVEVTAADLSAQMLEKLQCHAQEFKTPIRAIHSSFRDLPSVLAERFDAVFAMGNTLVHLLSDEDLRSTLQTFGTLLTERGILFVQNVNFDRILSRRETIQSVRKSGDTTYVRFYEYREDAVNFNILRLTSEHGTIDQHLLTTTLRPILHDPMVALLKDSGFTSVQSYGAITLAPFHKIASPDLVFLAQKFVPE